MYFPVEDFLLFSIKMISHSMLIAAAWYEMRQGMRWHCFLTRKDLIIKIYHAVKKWSLPLRKVESDREVADVISAPIGLS